MIVSVAIATRIVDFSNPLADSDVQFYLLTGRSMLEGQLPYIDIWDRKPPGLFLLYAALAFIGGGSILAVHLVATAFAAATALVIYQGASLISSNRGALRAALVYLLMLPLFGGQSGQSPVFYNMLIAAAGVLTLHAVVAQSRPSRRMALLAMLLCGLGLTIKQTSVFEGVFLGLAWLVLIARRGTSRTSLAKTAAAMVVIALLPTLACFGLFALADPSSAMAIVNAAYLSIFSKGGPSPATRVDQLLYLAVTAGPLAIISMLGLARLWRGNRSATAFVIGWLMASAGGYAIIPSMFVHYALPLLVPLSLATAAFLDRARLGLIAFTLIALLALSRGQITEWRDNEGSKLAYASVVRTVDRARHGGCLYIAAGPADLYTATNACRVTRYQFPAHLTYAVERAAIGTDQRAELARVLASRPAVVTTQKSERAEMSDETRTVLDNALSRDYRLIRDLGPQYASSLHTLRVWQRRDLLPPIGASPSR